MNSKQKRPKFLNLFAIHLPVTGITSFAHRVSGALLFLAIPALIYLFALSIRDANGYMSVIAVLDTVPVKMVATVLAWTITHHILAGIRFLLLDINVGDSLPFARATAWFVNTVSLVVTLVIASLIWL